MANLYYSTCVLTDEDVVLVRRRFDGPFEGRYELPTTPVDPTKESFRDAAARMVAGEMKVPLSKVETLATMEEDDLEGYDGKVTIIFFAGLIEHGSDLSHLKMNGWKLVEIRSLTKADIVPEHATVFDALGTSMSMAPDEITPIERN